MFKLLTGNKNLRRGLIVLILLALPHAVFSIAAPVVLGNIIDAAGVAGAEEVIGQVALLAALYAALALLQYLSPALSYKLSHAGVSELKNAAFAKFNSAPLKFIDGAERGDLIARVTADADAAGDGVSQGAARLFTDVLLIAGTLALLFYIDLYIALTAAALTPFSAAVSAYIARKNRRSFDENLKEGGALAGRAEEDITNLKTVKTFGLEGAGAAKFDLLADKYRKSGIKAVFYTALTGPSVRLIGNIVFAAVAALGGYMCINGFVTVGGLSAALTLAYQYGKPFNEISGVASELSRAGAAIKRLRAITEEPSETDGGDPTPRRFRGAVEFKDVSFSYGARPFIQGLNLKVAAGERVAVVGATGGGKTTLINLLMRFYEPENGAVEIDGVDIKTVSKAVLRDNIGMVLQESYIFHGTVAENIAYGSEGASRAQIEEAAKTVLAHGFISKLERGYDAVLDGGGVLSDGQRQQLALARVLLKDAPILLLDEATSNLDDETERNITRAVDRLTRGRTAFIVAHRLSTAENADKIIVIKNGAVAEAGTHKELMNLNGEYRSLYDNQNF